MFKNGEDCGRMKVITDKNRRYMHTILRIAVVSVLALFTIVGVVSISNAEGTSVFFDNGKIV